MFLTNFFTVEGTAPPTFALWWYLPLQLSFIFLGWLSYKYHQNKTFRHFFIILQIVQIISIYSWYGFNHLGVKESLPLYHCRIAMIGLLLLPNGKLKQFLALMGIAGTFFAFLYPVFDPFDFPHLTIFSFVLGHMALLVNSLNYLFRFYFYDKSWRGDMIILVLFLNAIMVLANKITGGNYGALHETPFMANMPLLVRYLAVTVVILPGMTVVERRIRKISYQLK